MADAPLPQDTGLRALYLAERDKHLAQLMAVNGKAVFAILALVITVILALDKLPRMPLTTGMKWTTGGLFVFGVLLLAWGAYLMASFHLERIRKLETKAYTLAKPDSRDFELVPPLQQMQPFTSIFFGSLALVASTLILVWVRVF